MEIPYTELAGVLGISRPRASSWGPVQIVDRIQRGLPISSVYSVSGQVAPGDSQFVFRIVPKASLARRKQGPKPLTADQSNRVARLASVWKVAESVWKEPEKAR